MKIESKELTFEQLVEIFKITNDLGDKKGIITQHIINLNNAVRDYENRISNAINQLER